MFNRFKIIMLSTCLLMVNRNFGHSFTSSLLAETRQHLDQVFSLMQAEIGHIAGELQINIEQESSYTKLAFSLPVATDNKHANKIDLHAKGRRLEGNLDHDGYRLSLIIEDGRMLHVNYRQEVDESIDSANQKSARKFITSFNKSILLPNYVDNLEKTEAKFDNDGKLILLLPNANSIKNGLHRIEIK